MTQYAIVTDLNRCVGCMSCMVACKAINNWVSKETNDMIPEILQEISPDDAMLLAFGRNSPQGPGRKS